MKINHDQLQQAVIASLLLWPETINEVAALINVDDFYHEKYRVVYRYLLENDGGDYVTACAVLKGQVNSADLTMWMDEQVTSAMLPKYCHELKNISNKIKLVNLGDEIRAGFDSMNAVEMSDRIESVLSGIKSKATSEPSKSKELIKMAMANMRKRYENKGVLQGIPYGIEELDIATNGIHPGELIVIAGRPSMGKSAFAGNILENISASGYTGMFFSLEMDKSSLTERMFSSRGGVSFSNIRNGVFEERDWPRLQKAAGEMFKYKMLIDDTPAVSLREIKNKARKQNHEGLDVVIIDYLQLMATSRTDNRVLAIGEISRGLKQLARELNVAVVLLSQLSRAVDSRDKKKPVMSDLRDSGEIEQDADVILFPFRPAAYCEKCKDKINDDNHNCAEHQMVAEIIIEKQRNGERNISVPVLWLGKHQKFKSLSSLRAEGVSV